MRKFLPFLQWLPNYKKTNLYRDLVAGLTVGVLLIPQSMAYAMIAGLPPVYGLYAAIFPLLIYLFLGTSKNLGIGPVAMDSILVAAGLSALSISGIENYIALAIFLAFLVGSIQLVLGVFRMGFLVNFLSKPVISGFTSAVALIIIFSQLKHFLGIKVAGSSRFHELLWNVSEKIGETNPYDFIIGLLGIVIIVLIKRWSAKFPSILLVVVLAIVSVRFLNLERFGIKVVGEIPTGLPSLQVPDFGWDSFLGMWPIALTLALVGYLEAISIGKAMQEKEGKESVDANQELIALGSANIVGSFFQAYPVTASFSRSAIQYESGAKTNLTALFSVVLIVITLLFLTPLFYYLPNAILASIIMVSVFGLIDLKYPRRLWQNNKDEFIVLLTAFLITLFIGIPQGVLVGVLLSLLLLVYRTSKPHFAVLGKIENSDYYKNIDRFGDKVSERDDLLIIRFDAQLYFGNVGYFKKQLFKELDRKGKALNGVILSAESINYIDSSASKVLVKVIQDIHERKIAFFIAGAIGPTRDVIFSSGIIHELHKECLFVNTKEAVACFDNPNAFSMAQTKVAHQNKNGL